MLSLTFSIQKLYEIIGSYPYEHRQYTDGQISAVINAVISEVSSGAEDRKYGSLLEAHKEREENMTLAPSVALWLPAVRGICPQHLAECQKFLRPHVEDLIDTLKMKSVNPPKQGTLGYDTLLDAEHVAIIRQSPSLTLSMLSLAFRYLDGDNPTKHYFLCRALYRAFSFTE